jgi:hypothetical protein
MWIVKKIGRIRSPREGEYYIASTGHFQCSMGIVGEPREILSVTPVPSREEWEKEFRNYTTNFIGSTMYDNDERVWFHSYDLLFGWQEQEEPYHWIDTFNGW